MTNSYPKTIYCTLILGHILGQALRAQNHNSRSFFIRTQFNGKDT